MLSVAKLALVAQAYVKDNIRGNLARGNLVGLEVLFRLDDGRVAYDGSTSSRIIPSS